MNRRLWIIRAAIALIPVTTLTAQAETTAADGIVEVDPATDRFPATTQVGSGTLRLTFIGEAPPPDFNDLKHFLDTLRWRAGGDVGSALTLLPQRYSTTGHEAVLTYCFSAPAERGLTEDMITKGREAFVLGLKRILTGDEPLRAEIRKAKLKELEIHLARVRAMREILRTMSQSQPSRSDELVERVKSLRAERERLEMTRLAREARDVALREALAQQRAHVEERLRSDPVADELRAVIKLREEEARRLQLSLEQGLGSPADLAEGRARLVEARVKLAEREAAAARAGHGEVLERLSAELAMVKVDLTDVEIQLSHLRDRLERLDPRKATTRSLGQVLDDGTVPVGAAGLPPLYHGLQREERELVRRKLAIQVEAVEETK